MTSAKRLLIATWSALLLAACSTGDAHDHRSTPAKASTAGVIIPSTLGDRQCNQVIDFNDKGEVLFSCPADTFDYRTFKFALWDGSTLRDLSEVRQLPPLDSNGTIQIVALGNNGDVFGVLGTADDPVTEPGTGDVISITTQNYDELSSFIARADELIHIPDPISGVSRDGNSFYTNKFSTQDGQSYTADVTAYHKLKPLTLAPVPPGLNEFNIADAIRNDGTVAGSIFIGSSSQSYGAGYGYLRSESTFDLLPSPGRAEFSSVFETLVNNSGSALLSYLKDETYRTAFDEDHNDQNVIGAALLLRDGSELPISHPNPIVNVSTDGVNDNDIVWGHFDNQSSLDLVPYGEFFFSPRSGFKVLEEVFPVSEGSYIAAVNNRNEVILFTEEGFVLTELPPDF